MAYGFNNDKSKYDLDSKVNVRTLKTNGTTPDIVTDYFTTASKSIAAKTEVAFTVTITKSGYIPIGISVTGIFGDLTYLKLIGCDISNNTTARVNIYNTSSSKETGVSAEVAVKYINANMLS